MSLFAMRTACLIIYLDIECAVIHVNCLFSFSSICMTLKMIDKTTNHDDEYSDALSTLFTCK